MAAHTETCSIRSLERRDVGLTSPGGHGCIPVVYVGVVLCRPRSCDSPVGCSRFRSLF